MNNSSTFKIYRGSRLPDFTIPTVIVTMDVQGGTFFFTEYFVIRQKTDEVLSYRLEGKERVTEFLARFSPEMVFEDTKASAVVAIEGRLVEEAPAELKSEYFSRFRIELEEVEPEKLTADWMLGRMEKQIREVASITRSESLQRKLSETMSFPRLKFEWESPVSPRPY